MSSVQRLGGAEGDTDAEFGKECCFFQAEDGIRDLVRSRGLGDVYKRQPRTCANHQQVEGV